MRRNLHKILMLCIIIAGLATKTALGVIAYPYPVKVTQPDGTTITVTLQGDEKVKWAITTDGYTLMYNNRGVYEYAIQDSKGDLQ